MKNNKEGTVIITTTVLMLVLVAGLFIGISTIKVPGTKDNVDQGLKYTGWVCVAKNDEPATCSHNLITNQGKNAIKNALTNGSTGLAINITVSNMTAAVATDTALPGYAAVCFADSAMCGTNGTVGSNGVGNWSVWKTFTATNAMTYNTTGLDITEAAGAATLFAGNTYTAVALQPNDQLSINWTIYVT